jgi:hypothetical protein
MSVDRVCNSSTREVLLKGRLSTVDLLAPTSLDRLIFILKILFFLFLLNKLP